MANLAPKKTNQTTKGFRCPKTSRRGVKLRNTASEKGWENFVDPGESKYKVMQRHENFLSSRERVSCVTMLDKIIPGKAVTKACLG